MTANLPHAMRAIVIAEPGGPEALVPTERPVPVPGPHEALFKVAATRINRLNVLQRKVLYSVPKDASDLSGLEVAGEVGSAQKSRAFNTPVIRSRMVSERIGKALKKSCRFIWGRLARTSSAQARGEAA